MFAVLLVPLLPLLVSLIVLVGDEGSRNLRAKIAACPIGTAFLGAIATLWLVATEGPSRPAPSAQLFSAPLRLCGWWRQRGPSPFVSMTLPLSHP